MPNVTLSIDDELLRAGREYARIHRTSLNAIVRRMLAHAVMSTTTTWIDELETLSCRARGRSRGWKWNRADAYDE